MYVHGWEKQCFASQLLEFQICNWCNLFYLDTFKTCKKHSLRPVHKFKIVSVVVVSTALFCFMPTNKHYSVSIQCIYVHTYKPPASKYLIM